MDQVYFGSSQKYFSNGLNDTVVKGYYKLLVDLAEYFGADRSLAEKEFEDVIKFQIDLAKVWYNAHHVYIKN